MGIGFPKPGRRKGKYGAVKTHTKWGEFASKLEAAVRGLLDLRERAGEIKDIRSQVPVRLKEKCNHCGAGAVVYKVDFAFTVVKTGQVVYCEAKGVETNTYKLRKRLWKDGFGPGPLEVWNGSHKKPHLAEVIP